MKLVKAALLAGVLGTGLLVGSVQANAEIGKDESTISIEITESKLKIESVQSPSFGKHVLDGEKHTWTADKDLVIKVKDQREPEIGPWALTYTFSPFNVDVKEASAMIYSIGQGSLTREDGQETAGISHPHEIEVDETATTTSPLVELTKPDTSSNGEYVYTVPKEKITVSIPKEMKAGNYSAKEILNLIDAPTE